MSVNQATSVAVAHDPRTAEMEELDAAQVEALRWLRGQLLWERTLTNLRSQSAPVVTRPCGSGA